LSACLFRIFLGRSIFLGRNAGYGIFVRLLMLGLGSGLSYAASISPTPVPPAIPAAFSLGLPAVVFPVDNSSSAAKVALGQTLFFDRRFSRDGSVSCASCHQPNQAFADGRAVAQGVRLQSGTRNTPSLLNVAFNTSLFWDGRRTTLEEQALDPLLNPREHDLADLPTLLKQLRQDPAYVQAFQRAFGVKASEIEPKHVGQALASFERTLIAADAPFDRYAFNGETSSLSAAAIRGLALFKGAAQCAVCHTIGPNDALLTDQQFHGLRVGLQRIEKNLPALTMQLVEARRVGNNLDQTVLSREELAELGRFAVTLKPVDIARFRTPSLRNVAVTAPYMHDGSVATLEEAVELEIYYRGAEAGRPLILTPQEKADLVSFLASLTSPAVRWLAAQMSEQKQKVSEMPIRFPSGQVPRPAKR